MVIANKGLLRYEVFHIEISVTNKQIAQNHPTLALVRE